MKVLISCYACSPVRGSEPGMGWGFVRALSALHDLHVIVEEEKFRVEIEEWLKAHPSEMCGVTFHFIPKTRHRLLRRIWPPSYYWFYAAWQKKALRLARELDRKEDFDVVHQLNMVGFRECGGLWRLGKPTVWGPVGGMHLSPWCLLPSIGLYGMLYYGLRNILNIWDMHMKTGPIRMAFSADAIISATQDTACAIKRLWDRSSVIIPEVGSIQAERLSPCRFAGEEPLRICWCGQHTPAKGLNFLLDALGRMDNPGHYRLHVLGDGRCTEKWKRMARERRLDGILWHGWVRRESAIKIMSACHVLVITSLADLTSTVLMEALSMGLPVIAPDLFGFSNVLSDSCGVKVPATSRQALVSGIKDALARLHDSPEQLRALREGALKEASLHTFGAKAEIIDEIYRKIKR